MSTPLTTDLIVGLDPTGATAITGAQLAQLVNAANPQNDKGLIIVTTDGSPGNPVVPDASTTTKWQRYLWLRRPLAYTHGIQAYIKVLLICTGVV